MEKLFLIAFILMVFQGLLTYVQIKNYRLRLSKLSKEGIIGVGTRKGVLKAGNITILVCDRNGLIIRGEKMEGITVFTRFKEIKDIAGMTLAQLKEKNATNYNPKGKKPAILQAIESLEERLKKI